MTDVFISYSRKDREFIQKLHQSLATLNRDVWVDWEDIPVTAEWWKEICAGIQDANAFAFVISPDSAQSRVCYDEVQFAVQNNKRIIPILHKELMTEAERSQLHPAVHSHNWIFFRETDPYDPAFQTLLSAIDTDLDHVRRHTRLMVRAQEWMNKGQDASFLLIGTDFNEAEKWLDHARGKDPQPTPMHIEYVGASRRALQRRQHTYLLIGCVVAAVISALLALFGVTQFSSAQRLEIAYAAAQSAVATTESFLPFTTVQVNWLDIHERISLTSPVIARANRGDVLRVLGKTRDEEWLLVRTEDGTEGFVNADAVRGLQQVTVEVPIIDAVRHTPVPRLP
jgi:hypothetical protein